MDRKISELDQVLNLDEQAEFPLSQDNGGTPTTFKAKLTQLAAKIAEAITFSNLITNDKHIIGAINEAAQGSGASMKFEDLSDVDISNLQDGQFSKYDSTTEKWKNTTIQESDVANLVSDLANKADKTDLVYEKTASGSIATFTDGGDDIPVSEYECEIVAQQASGTPTPVSPLPISGFSQADIPVSGKNLCNTNAITDVVFNDQQQTRKGLLIPCSGTFTISVKRAYTNNTWIFAKAVNADGTFGTVQYVIQGTTTYDTTITVQNGGHLIVYSSETADLAKTIFEYCELQIEVGTTATTYEPYKGTLYTVAFGQTIYGGKLVYKNGEWSIKATHRYDYLSTSDTWNYSSGWSKTNTNVFYGTQFHPEIKFPDFDYSSFAKCSHLGVGSRNEVYEADTNMLGLSGNTTAGQLTVRIDKTICPDLASFVQWITDNQVYYVYELATPVIIPITSSTRIKTISGVNNIFSNTGDNSVKYFTENADSLAELVKAEIASTNADYHEYSATEQIVGKWIDGHDLYEKTVVVTNKTSQPSDWAEVVTLSDVDKVAHVEGWFTISTVDYFEGYYVRFMFDHSTNKLKYFCQDMANTNGDITVIIRYTKTSSNTRSLNLSKSIEETPIEEKNEEVKTEEVKEEEK